jgi:hypothetical protein
MKEFRAVRRGLLGESKKFTPAMNKGAWRRPLSAASCPRD